MAPKPPAEFKDASTAPTEDNALVGAALLVEGFMLVPTAPVMFAAVSWLAVTDKLVKSVAASTCLAKPTQEIWKFSKDTTAAAEAVGTA
jgi:hypothetical protein